MLETISAVDCQIINKQLIDLKQQTSAYEGWNQHDQNSENSWAVYVWGPEVFTLPRTLFLQATKRQDCDICVILSV